MQKSAETNIYLDDLATKTVLDEICQNITGQSNYDTKFVDNDYEDEFLHRSYNKGRLVILQYQNRANYISLSDEKCNGRNQGLQSVPTAFNQFYSNSYKDKKLYFYFLPCEGNNATVYFRFMYRLMKTIGFNFINTPPLLDEQLKPFTTIEDLIRAKKESTNKNTGNNATYILKNASHEYEIYGKTYGANKYETSLLCYAVSKIADKNDQITLYQYNDNNLKFLPKSTLNVLRSMNNIAIKKIDDTLESKEFNNNNSLRSPRFNIHLLERLGDKRCVLCKCSISELVQGAHIWPVSEIKKEESLSDKEKLDYATDGENGLWMCQNHHKLFDSDILTLSEDGKVLYKKLTEDDYEYIRYITTVATLPSHLITETYKKYIEKRYIYK